MPELKQFKLPDVGEGLTEADIVRWHVRPGDEVTVNQTIVEIETAKATVELPCPFDGVVAGLLALEGDTVDVGTPIISIDVSAGTGEPAAEPPDAGQLATTAPAAQGAAGPGMPGSPARTHERQPVLVGYGVKLGTGTRRPRKPGAARATVALATPAAVAVAGRVMALAKPPVRKLARELGIDLGAVEGSGPGGSITRADVQAAAEAAPHPAAGPPAGDATAPGYVTAPEAGPGEERIAVRGVRKHTAAAVAASAFAAPHVTEFLQIDMTDTMAAVRRIRDLPEFTGVRVSPLLLVAKALLLAVARHPMINSSWDGTANEIVVKRYVNLGIAAATKRGLIVPNIKDAGALPLRALAGALSALTETARAGRTAPADLRGGTITITNVGVFGVDSGTPILTPGEAAILAFGQVRDMPWVHDGELTVRQVCTLAMSFDHRIVDGDLGSAALRDLGAMLEDPVRMLAWA